jgi:spermidine synthase
MTAMPLDHLEMLASAETPIGLICLWRGSLPSDPQTLVTEITLDHTFLMSSHFCHSEHAFATRALEIHPKEGARVLVGGLGLGHTAHAALQDSRVAHVEVVELLPEVIDWLDRGLIPLAPELASSRRLSVRRGDVYRELAGPPRERWDHVLIDVDHSPDRPLDPETASFYTASGLECAKQHLAPNGVLAVWSSGESPPFAETLRSVFGKVTVESMTAVNPKLGEEETNWFFIAQA